MVRHFISHSVNDNGHGSPNLAKHHNYAFHEIENIERPFLVIFFILAGASLDISMLAGLGLIGFIYILARICGKLLGLGWGLVYQEQI